MKMQDAATPGASCDPQLPVSGGVDQGHCSRSYLNES